MTFEPIGIDICDVCHKHACLVAQVDIQNKGKFIFQLRCKKCFTVRHIQKGDTKKRCKMCKMIIDESETRFKETMASVTPFELYHTACNIRRSNKMTRNHRIKTRFYSIYPKIIQWLTITSSVATIVTLYIFMNIS